MTLKPGTWLNHYEVLDHLGTGGMGEVYRARDNKLQREVALKVLPKTFAQDPERLARFRREAQVLAQLNHVNIAAIYSVEESGGTHFLVMELAQGETLRERIKRGSGGRQEVKEARSREVKKSEETQDDPQIAQKEVQVPRRFAPRDDIRGERGGGGGIPVEEALEIAKQIAAGLEAAHEKPIVHRDLKPANIKVTPEGVVKILDFGLARAFAGDTGSGDPADSPTLTGMTQPGTILGTAAYMSPEQARGKTVDKRTDIWALGCVLFEMLTGKHAFEGDDVQEILAGVMKGEPDWAALPAATPHGVRVLLRRCLQKDKDRRLRDAGDARVEIEEVLAASATTVAAVAPAAAPRSSRRQAVAWGLVGLAACVLTGIAVWNLKPAPAPTVTRLTVSLPANEPLSLRAGALPCPQVALSPDGSFLAYVTAAEGGVEHLYLRSKDSFEARIVPGVDRIADSLFFSPDGQWLGFWADGKLKKIATSGGAPITLTTGNSVCGGSWAEDGTIVFGLQSGLQRISADGGTPHELTKVDSAKGESFHGFPEFLPGGKSLLFTAAVGGNWIDARIVLQRLDTGERKVLIEGGSHGHYVSPGYLVYARAGTLLAVAFDLARLEITGRPVTLVEGVFQATTGASKVAISQTGTLAYVPGGSQEIQPRTLVWVDRKGAVQPFGAPPRPYGHPQLSPDGRQLAVTVEAPKDDIWVYDISRGALTRLTFEGTNSRPLWTPDGKRIAFRTTKEGVNNLAWKLADGTGPEEQITKVDIFFTNPSSISPDGKLAFYHANDPETDRDLWMVPLEGERKPSLLLQTPFFESTPRISPDGRWLAYVSSESGRNEIYVRSFPGPSGKWQISTESGGEPLWARSGGELFYRNGDKMMAVDITTQPSFRAGAPRLLFEGKYESRQVETNYDISPDGQRFLMIKAGEQQEQGAAQINVVLNWFEELKRRVPTGQ